VLYERLARPVLFRLGGGDAEVAHDRTIRWLARAERVPGLLPLLRLRYAIDAPRDVFGLRFPNPVGLAAGMDKNGLALRAWPALGFGFVEVGTVTPRGQPGNPRPRLFRLKDSDAIINRMGFNNEGAEALAARCSYARGSATGGPDPVPIGISLGKSRSTPVEEAVDDYVRCLRLLYPHGDYFVVNVSSPNTPGLRTLQDSAHLAELLAEIRALSVDLSQGSPPKPLLVKVAPDLTDPALAEAVDVCLRHDVAGIVATNTTVGRDGLHPRDRSLGGELGGLSGRPLTLRAREVVHFVHRETGGRLPVVGVGGIVEVEDAARLFDAGASLVQVCTGLIYRGPRLVRAINRDLRHRTRAGLGDKPAGVAVS
jgi:dihydroorotate dehydrogenase